VLNIAACETLLLLLLLPLLVFMLQFTQKKADGQVRWAVLNVATILTLGLLLLLLLLLCASMLRFTRRSPR
jgi:hypothetical protein